MQMIQTAIEALRAHNDQENDPEDAALISKTVAALRGVIAKRHKEKDTAMGIGPKEKHMRRMAS